MQTCIGIRSGISSSDCILFESILFHLNQLKQVQTRFQDQLMQLSPSDGDDVEIRYATRDTLVMDAWLKIGWLEGWGIMSLP